LGEWAPIHSDLLPISYLRKMYRGFTIIFSLLTCCTTIAQQQKIIFDHYGTQQGFNSRVCRTVVKTADGMVWITTSNGLVCYDSKKFRFFQHDVADSTSIASNFTDQLAADKEGRIWLVAGGGIDTFDPQTEKFSHCYVIHEGKKKEDFNPESLLYDSATNRIWAGSRLGLFYCTPGSNQFIKAKAGAAADEILGQVFFDIKKGKGETIWLCNSDGFYQYNPSTGFVKTFHVPGQNDHVKDDDAAFCLFPESEEIIWIGTWTKGLVRYNLLTGTGKHYYYSDYTKEQNGITFISATGLQNEKDMLWLSTANKGLASFNKKTGSFTFYYSELQNNIYGIKGLSNRHLPTTTEGMWIASENGLHRYDYAKQLFNTVDLKMKDPLLANALPLDFFQAVPAENGAGNNYFFLVPYLGFYQYNSKTGSLSETSPFLKKYVTTSIFAAFTDAEGVYWLSTGLYGLVGFDLKKKGLVFPEYSFFNHDREWVTGFAEDNQKQLWLSTYKGLYLFNRNEKKAIPVTSVNDALNANKLSLHIEGLTQDDKGRFWMLAASDKKEKKAIVRFDAEKNKTQLYFDAQHSKLGFPGWTDIGSVTSCGGQVYAATGAGLLMFSSEDTSPRFRMLTVKDGLVANAIRQLVSDKENRIWCSTDFGVSCYIPDKKFVINYLHTTSGIGPQRAPSLYLSPNTGLVYASQQGGFNYFNPGNITTEAAPRIRFTGMQLFNQPYLHNNRQLQDGDEVKLKHNQNMISVEFTGMSFSNPDDNQFSFMLEGLEKEWNVSKNNIASYMNLAPGTYKLLVKASNGSGVWTKEPSVITFVIRPPFWKTWWFIPVIGLVIVGAIYSLYRYRINQLLRVQKMRNTISRNLHDEIGSTLTSISILSNVSQQAMEKEPQQAKEMLQKIATQSKTIQQNMSDIVWAIRSDTDKIEDLLVRMREYAAQTLEPLQIKTGIAVDEALVKKSLGLETRKEILLIYKEAVNNIAKHAGATAVSISLQKNNSDLLLQINDNGKWKGNGKSSGTGITSMQHRAAAIGGQAEITHTADGTSVIVMAPIT
jgi:ligand-binding sensor domain-containing protein/two-component sensor histidine kinase